MQNELIQYLNQGIEQIVMGAMKATFSNPRETVFITKFLKAHKKATRLRQEKEMQGNHIPPFLIASITSKCNLFCTGCYSRANNACFETENMKQLSAEEWSRIFDNAKALGVEFILLAGGEPFLRRDVIGEASRFPEIIFPIFTNGTVFTEEDYQQLDGHRNLIPVLSLEGNEEKTDQRRGRGTYNALLNAMENMSRRGVFFGASITVTKENIKAVTEYGFIENLKNYGCKLVFYVEYVPVDETVEGLAPTDEDRTYLEEAQKKLRQEFEEMLFISFPGDEKESGGCLAAGRGFFHINVEGGVEPCPFSPYSDTSLKENTIENALQSPLFRKLKENNLLEGEHSGGCVLFDKEEQVKKIMMEV